MKEKKKKKRDHNNNRFVYVINAHGDFTWIIFTFADESKVESP